MIDLERIVRNVAASAFDEDAAPATVTIRLSPAAKSQAARLLEQSNQQHREFGGYVEGTATGSAVTFTGFSHEVSGVSQHVTVPWMDSDKTVAGWHSHPDQYEGSNLVPETDNDGDPSPSTGNDFKAFDQDQARGHLSVILGNGRMVVYNGRDKVHSEEIVAATELAMAASMATSRLARTILEKVA